MNEPSLGLGIIGCGGFGLFALQQFAQVPGVRLAAMAGTHREAARRAAQRFGMDNMDDVEQMVRRDDVGLVYIATPPFLHYSQATAALQAGKHVLCEKPLATELSQADEMMARAQARDCLLATNLIQRYNPLSDAVKELIDGRVLGEPLHGYFENYASDESLTPDHWFWDRSKSGGIFVEHGVHFFDLLAAWLGEGRVLAAQRTLRPGSLIEEQAQCTLQYGESVLFNFYHGFHQPGRLDRQELRIVFERGDITLSGWVPTQARLHALVNEEQTRALCQVFPGARLDVTQTYHGPQRLCEGRHHQYDVYQQIELTTCDDDAKLHRYGDLLRHLIEDQMAWIADRSHPRKSTEQNGRHCLALALEADQLAADTSHQAGE